MAEPTKEELMARIAELERNAAEKKQAGALSFKVSEKGAISVYGMGRFPVTLYYEQWVRLFAAAGRHHRLYRRKQGQAELKEV